MHLRFRSFCNIFAYLRHGAGFQKHETILIGEFLSLFVCYLACALQIGFIANEKDHSAGICEIARIGEPAAQMIIRGAVYIVMFI